MRRCRLQHDLRAVDLFRAADHRTGEAGALNATGWVYAHLGDHQQALTYCRKALDLLQVAGDRYVEAATWDSLAYIHVQHGEYRDGAPCYQRSADLYRELGDRYFEALVRTRLGDTHTASDDAAGARLAWLQAVTILEELHHPEAQDVRLKLHRLSWTPSRV